MKFRKHNFICVNIVFIVLLSNQIVVNLNLYTRTHTHTDARTRTRTTHIRNTYSDVLKFKQHLGCSTFYIYTALQIYYGNIRYSCIIFNLYG